MYYEIVSILTKIILALKTIKNFPIFLLDYFGFLHRDIIYSVRPSSMKMVARGGTNDCKEIIVVMSGHEYPLHKLPTLESPVIFDVGAHIGSFSLFALHYYRKKSPRLFAFEPNRENFHCLQKNLELNAIPENQVTLYPCALGDYEGTGKLDTSKSNDAYTLAESPKGAYELCKVRTLPNIAKEADIKKIDILKMDIEGGEYRMLKHEPTFNFIKDDVTFIFIEHHFVDTENNADWILERLQNDFELLFQRGDVFVFKNQHEFSIVGPGPA